MVNISESHSFSIDDKTLHAFLVSLRGDPIPADTHEIIKDAFEQIAPFLQDAAQVLYIRDIEALSVDGTYSVGHCSNRSEAMVAVPSWQHDSQQLIAAINHELHHMTRWQNAGYGDTLGGALLSEGIATFYEKLRSGWESPWSKAAVSTEAIHAALEAWDSKDYDHNAWFYDGPHGKWSGYGIGLQLAITYFKQVFDLKASLTVTPDEVKQLLS